ncbi:MAG TPA: hypothetical protein VIM65_15485 [Cyclobacteriaceae bacterium]
MKKLFYTILLVLASSFALISCTEEPVTPATDLNGGGGVSDPMK